MSVIAANYLARCESDGSQVYRYLISNPSVREIVTSQDFLNSAHVQIGGAISRDANKIALQDPGNTFFGHTWAIFVNDDYVPVPGEKIVNIFEPPKNKGEHGKRWHSRNRTNDILVSNRLIGQAHFSYVPGYKLPWEGPVYRDNCYAAQTGLFELSASNSQHIVLGGWVWEGPRFNKVRYAQTREQLTTFPAFPESAVIQFIKQEFSKANIDQGLVTSCLADANSGTIDALTAMAEMPETIKSIIDGCKLMTSMYVDSRNKALRLYNKGKSNTDLGQSRETLLRNMRETADAISNVWLNYRYNITPTVMVIEDLLKTLDSNVEQFVRFRTTKHKRDEISHRVDGWELNSQFSTVHRTLIKRFLNLDMGNAKMHHLVLTNTAVTLWELTPYSFVWDWFINIGDFVTATFVNPSIGGQGSTYSWQREASLEYIHVETNARVIVDVTTYRRDVINPSSHVSLTWDPSLGWKRQLDALALGWNIHKTSIMKSFSRGLAKKG